VVPFIVAALHKMADICARPPAARGA